MSRTATLPAVEMVFVRHGEPAWGIDGISQPDPLLTELGREQAHRAAKRIASDPIPTTEILVSGAQRALQTAEPIAQATGVDPVVVPDLTEIRMPDWDGQLEETVQRIFLEARSRPAEEWWDGLEGGESFRDFHARVTSRLVRLLGERGIVPDTHRQMWRIERGDIGRIVVVAHGGTNAVALGWLLGVEATPWEWERFVLGHASFARVKAVPLAGAHVFSLRTFNDCEHLDDDMRTR
jgi:broad specificity phosphatase PhoE